MSKLPKLPKTAAAAADELWRTRETRLKLGKEVKALEERESELREHIINILPKSEASGVAGKLARVQVVVKPVPQVQDWDMFYKHVKKTGEFDLFQRRLNEGAIKERWEHKKEVPGVGVFNAVTLSLTKVGS